MNELARSGFLCIWLWTSLARTSKEDFQNVNNPAPYCKTTHTGDYLTDYRYTCECNIVNDQRILPTAVFVLKKNLDNVEINCFSNNITSAELRQFIDRCAFKNGSLKYSGSLYLLVAQCTISDTPIVNHYFPALQRDPSSLTLNSLTINTEHGLEPYHFENLTSLQQLCIINTTFNKSMSSRIFEKMPNIILITLSNNSINCLPNERFQATPKHHRSDNNLTRLIDGIRFPPELRGLQIRHNNLQYITKNVIDNLTPLRYLELDNNRIQRFDDDIFDNLIELMRLDFSNNNLTQLGSNLFSHNHKLSEVNMNNSCAKELSTLPSRLFANLTFLRYVDMRGNYFTTLPSSLFENCHHLYRVNLESNFLKTLPGSIFQHTVDLEQLNLSNNKLRTLPVHIFQNAVYLNKLNLNNNELDLLDDTIFHNLRKLVRLYLRNAFSKDTSTLPPALFANMTSLRELHLNENNLTQLPVNLFQDCIELEILDLSDNQLNFIVSAFSLLTKLRELRLARNRLVHTLHLDADFCAMKSLRKLDLSSNRLTNPRMALIKLRCLDELIEVDLSHNQSDNEFDEGQGLVPWGRKLETVVMRNNNIEYLEHYWVSHMSKSMKLLDLSFNKFSKIRQLELELLLQYKKDRQGLFFLDFSHNRIETIPVHEINKAMEKKDTTSSRQRYSKNWKWNDAKIYFNFSNNHILCDCNALDLVNYVQQQDCTTDLQFVDLRCYQPQCLRETPLEDIDLLDLKCPLSSMYPEPNKNCPNGCNCEYGSAGNRIIVNCTGAGMPTLPLRVLNISGFALELHFSRNNFTSLNGLSNSPFIHSVTKLILSFNQLNNIDDLHIGNSLKVLELDNNQLSYMSESTIQQLSASKTLTNLTLHNNPWQCDCSHQYFADFLQPLPEKRRSQISHYENITCHDNGQSIVQRGNLCYELILHVLVPICVLLIIALISGKLYYKYQTEIKVWLFAHRFCRCIFGKIQTDENVMFDAFVGFSRKDLSFVEDHLMTQLEPRYNLCVWKRDFIVGRYIIDQIAEAVELSRLTIIVLSRNFLESTFGPEDFRIAHNKAIRDRRERVIIILLDDIDTKDINNPALKAYLSARTSIRWGDPFFWQTLNYRISRL